MYILITLSQLPISRFIDLLGIVSRAEPNRLLLAEGWHSRRSKLSLNYIIIEQKRHTRQSELLGIRLSQASLPLMIVAISSLLSLVAGRVKLDGGTEDKNGLAIHGPHDSTPGKSFWGSATRA